MLKTLLKHKIAEIAIDNLFDKLNANFREFNELELYKVGCRFKEITFESYAATLIAYNPIITKVMDNVKMIKIEFDYIKFKYYDIGDHDINEYFIFINDIIDIK